jgi:citronellol/citronellal dehydrogenase
MTVALVTGASRGIGEALALRLGEEGIDVACVARTVEAHPTLPGSLTNTVSEIEAAGGRAEMFVCDLSDGDDRAGLVARVEAAMGPIDMLINNAAALIYGEPSSLSLKRRRLMFEVNVHAPIDLAQAVIPGMLERGRGCILNITSAEAHHRALRAHRGAARLGLHRIRLVEGALDRYTGGLAGELAGTNVAVCGLAPVAAVRTPATDVFLGDLHERRPDLFEPIEDFVEAAFRLVTGEPSLVNGIITRSDDVLSMLPGII